MKRIEDTLRQYLVYDNIKHTNIPVIGVPEEEERKKSTEKFFEEIIVENFSQHGKGNSQSSPRSIESLTD